MHLLNLIYKLVAALNFSHLSLVSSIQVIPFYFSSLSNSNTPWLILMGHVLINLSASTTYLFRYLCFANNNFFVFFPLKIILYMTSDQGSFDVCFDKHTINSNVSMFLAVRSFLKTEIPDLKRNSRYAVKIR